MANQFLNAQVYSNTMLLLLKNQLVTGRLVDGQFKNEVTDQNGLTTNVKRPPRFVAKDGAALQEQDIVTGSVPVTVNQYKNVHISVGDIEYVSSFNELMQNATMQSEAQTLATAVDAYLQDLTLGFNNWVGTPGYKITSTEAFNRGHTRLMDGGVPNTQLSSTVLFTDGAKIRGSMLSQYLPPDVNRAAMERVKIPIISEVDLYATQMCPSFTTGTRVASATTAVNGAGQNVNYRDVKTTMTQSLVVDGEAGTYTAGEVFTIAGVYDYDWRRHVALPYLKQFTIVTGRTGAGAITISPPIIVPGTSDGTSTDANTAFATVSAAPADNALLTFMGAPSTSFRVRSAFHKRAIALVSAKLQTPFTGVSSFANDPDTGISIRYWRGSDINTGKHIHRWDMIFGATVTDRSLGVRINGLSTDATAELDTAA